MSDVSASLFTSTRDLHHLEHSLAAARAARELAPGDPRPLKALIFADLRGHRTEEARAALATLTGITLGDPELHVLAGRLAESQGDLQQAELETAVVPTLPFALHGGAQDQLQALEGPRPSSKWIHGAYSPQAHWSIAIPPSLPVRAAQWADPLLLADRGAPEIAASFALDRRGGTDPFPVSRTVVRQALAGTALLAGDVLTAGDLAGAESLRAARVRSLLAAPVAHLGRALGLLYVDVLAQEPPGPPLDAGHLEILTAFCGALAGVRQMEWLAEENRRLAEGLSRGAGGMVGESPRMREVYRLLRRAAASDTTVLLRGESGTGKEVAARALHRESPRAAGPFVAINCATLSENLLESELFGHEKGAFTGAVARKTGKAEAADGGTLFLDEIGELPLPLQAKLLRFLQEREFERVGGTRPLRVDVRVGAATNRDLEKAQGYDWPGNVRELANAVERAIVLGEGGLIRPEDLPETVLEAVAPPEISLGRYHETLYETKKRLIRAAVAEAAGNMTRAAALLGLQPTYLHRLINKLDLREDLG